MDFAFTDEQQMIAETAKAFFSENATSERTRAAMAADGIDRSLWQDFCQQLGFSGIGIAEERGGAGLGLVEMAIIAEAAGAQVAALPMLGSLGLAAQAIAAGGSEAQRAQWLGQLISGDIIAAHVADPDAEMRDGKLYASSQFVAHGAAAGLLYVAGAGSGWLVRADAPGVTIIAQTTMDQTRPLARIEIAGAAAEALADPRAAAAASQQAGLVMLAAEGLGIAQAALERTVAYSRDRVQFGRAIGSFQAYKHRLADMMVEIEQARSAVYWAACACDEQSAEAPLALHAAKSFTADTAFRCAADMIQLHGGIGFTWEHDAHLFFKRARALQTMLGDGASHREQIAAMILGEIA
jgi:alkylation response protein AidB-like acyl-CoA dehydrogenase